MIPYIASRCHKTRELELKANAEIIHEFRAKDKAIKDDIKVIDAIIVIILKYHCMFYIYFSPKQEQRAQRGR